MATYRDENQRKRVEEMVRRNGFNVSTGGSVNEGQSESYSSPIFRNADQQRRIEGMLERQGYSVDNIWSSYNDRVQKKREALLSDDGWLEQMRIAGLQEKYNWHTAPELETALEGMPSGEDKDYLNYLYGALSTQERYGGKVDQQQYQDVSKALEDAETKYFDLRNQLNLYSSGGAMADSRLKSDPYLEDLRKQVEAAKADYDALTEQKTNLKNRQWFADKSDEYAAVTRKAKSSQIPMSWEEAKSQSDKLRDKWWQVEYELPEGYATEEEAYQAREDIYNQEQAARQYLRAFKTDNTYKYINNTDGFRDKANEADKKQHTAEPYKKLDFMTEDEIKTYNFIYAYQGKQAANDYLEYLSYFLDEQNQQRIAQQVSEAVSEEGVSGVLRAIGANIASVPANLVSGAGLIDAALQKAGNAVTGEYKPINFHTAAMTPNTVTQAIRGTTAQRITDATGTIQLDPEDHPFWSQILNGKGLADVYQVGMSMADSAAVAGLSYVGIPGTILLGGSAGTQGVLDALERGATDDQALTMGILNGTFEALFEYVSLEKLLNEDVSKSLLRRVLEQAGVEGSEEVSTTLANTIADWQVMGDKSEMAQAYREYREAGDSEQEASEKAWADFGTGVLWDFVGGAVSGGLMDLGKAGLNAILGNSPKYANYKNQYGEQSQALVDQALTQNPESKAAQKAQNVLQKGGELSGRQIYNVLQGIQTQDKAAIQTAAQNRLTELGESWGDVSKVSAALAKQAAGEKLNRAERRAIQFSHYGNQVAAELNPQTKFRDNTAPEWTGKIGTQRLNTDYYSRTVQTAQTPQEAETAKNVPVSREGRNPAQTVTAEAVEPVYQETSYAVSDSGKTTRISTGETVQLQEVADIGEDGMKIRVDDDSIVDADDISFASRDEALLYEGAYDLGADAPAANAIINTYKEYPGNVPVQDYVPGAAEAFRAGQRHYPISQVAQDPLASKLTDTQRNAAYAAGRNYARRASAAKEASIKQSTGKTAKTSKGEGKVHFDRKGRTFSEAQETGLKTMEILSKAIGTEYYVFESYEKDGQRVYRDENGNEKAAPNGFYDPKTGAIHIDLNAGSGGRGTVLFTLSHELTHFIRQWSPTKFDALAEAVMNYVYEKKNINVKERIQAQQAKAQQAGITLTEDEAYEEMIADSMEPILRDGNVLNELMEEVKQKDATLWEKIKQWFSDLAEHIRRTLDAYKDYAPDSYEGRAVASMESYLKVLEGFYADALSTAGENFREAQSAEKSTAQEDGVKYMARITDTEGLSIKEQIRNAKDILEKMEPVVSVSVKDLSGMNQNQKYKWALETLKTSGFKVDRQGFGVITFSEKQINTGMNYLHSEGEVEALAALPRVLKRGRIIYEKSDHKSRNFGTVTIAAPVRINSQTGYMGVVVQMTSDNHYHTHRILMPDGSSFVFEQKNTAPGPSGDPAEEARRATNTSAVSSNFISQPGGNVKDKFSLRDSDGRELSPGGEYFKELKTDEKIISVDGAKYSTRDFSQQVDDVKNNIHNPNNHVYMGTTPTRIAKILGIPKLPMLITSQHIYTMAVSEQQAKLDGRYRSGRNYHDLGWDTIKKLPEYIKDPTLIIKSNTDMTDSRFLIVTSETDKNGRPLVVAMQPKGKGYYFNVEVPASITLSGYGRKNIQNYVTKAKGENRILYANKNSQKSKNIPSVQYANNILSSDYSASLADFQKIVKDQFKGTIFENSQLPSFSLRDTVQEKALKSLQTENDRLKEDVTRLKELVKLQGKLTYGKLFSESYIEDTARSLKKTADADVRTKGKTKELSGLLRKMYTDIANGPEINLDRLEEAAKPVVDWLWENKRSRLDPYAETVLNDLKGRKITVSKQQAGEIFSSFDSLEAYRKRLSGTVRLVQVGTEGAMDLDSFWQEMADAYPGTFDADVNEGDMPEALADIIGRLQSMAYKDYEQESPEVQDAMRQELFYEVYETFWQAKTTETVADRKQKEIDRLNELNEEHKQKIRELKATHEKTVSDLKAEKETALDDLRETNRKSQEVRKHRRNIEKKVKKLMDALVKNSDKEHIPEALKGVVGDFLNSIDFSSKSMIKHGTPTKRDISYTEALGRLREVFQKQENLVNGVEDGNFLNDFYMDLPTGFAQAVQEHIDKVASAAKGLDPNANQVFAMGPEELQNLDYILTVITKSVSQINKLLTNAHFQTTAEAAETSIREMDELGQDKARSKAANGAYRFLQWNNATPYYVFKRMGKGAQSVFEGLQDGWDRLAFNAQSIIDFAEETYTPKEVKKWTEDVKTVELSSGETIRLTTAQLMSIYCLSQREQGKQHLFGGGIRIGDFEMKQKTGKVQVSSAKNYTLTVEDVAAMNGMLSDRQKAVAGKLQEYMNTVGTQWGNEVSMKRFGYQAFTEDHYFPIQSDSGNLPATNTDTQNSNSLYRLLNLSMTKSLNKHANNAVVVGSIFDVFADHMSDMAKYNALALPVLDAMKWYNYKIQTKNESGQVESTAVKRSMESAFGKSANSYFTNLIKDINGTNEGGKGTDRLSRKMISNYKVAAVAGNLRVALLQPTAYVRATAVLNPKYLARGLAVNPVKAAREAEKYSGIAAWKSMGFYDTGIARGIREQIKHDTGVKDALVEKSMVAAEWGDRLTWGVLWNACKVEVQETRHLTGDALMEATAKRFREVVYKTQVVDSTMTRSQSMRDTGGLSVFTTAFMAEPTLSYNMLMDAYSEYANEARRTGDKGKAWGKAKNAVVRTLVSYTLTSLASALAEGLMDAWRDDDEYETFLEKFLEHFEDNVLDDLNPLTKLPVVKDVLSFLDGYDNGRMDTEWAKNLVHVYNIWKETYALKTGDQEKATSVTYNGKMTLYGKLYNTLKAMSQVSGMPFSNSMREVATIWNNTVGVIIGKKLRTYDPGPAAQIKYAYLDGYLSQEEATQELLKLDPDNGGAKDTDDAYFKIRNWETDKGRYAALDKALQQGQSIDGAVKDLTSHGIKPEEVQSHIKRTVGGWYKDNAISREEAISMLKKNTDMDSAKITAAAAKWDWDIQYPEYADLSEEAVSRFASSGVSAKVYYDACKFRASVTGDKDADGNTVSGSKKEKVMKYIASLNISDRQKDSLWDAIKGNWKGSWR